MLVYLWFRNDEINPKGMTDDKLVDIISFESDSMCVEK